MGIFGLSWTTWAAIGVGFLVTGVIIGLGSSFYRRRLKRKFLEGKDVVWEELPWEDLLELLKIRSRQMEQSGATIEGELPPDELLNLLLSQLPAQSKKTAEVPPEEKEYLEKGAERRTSRRRWGNPTEVSLTSATLPRTLHGLIINRSTGGLAIFVDENVPAGTVVKVRSKEAPHYVPSVEIEVRFARAVSRNFLLGCQFREEVPWNVLVWFG